MTSTGADCERWIQLLREEQPDILHIINPSGLGVSLIYAARHLAIKVVLTVVDSWWECPKATLKAPDTSICSGHKSAGECASCVVYTETGLRLPRSICKPILALRALSLKDAGAFSGWHSRVETLMGSLTQVSAIFFLSRDKMESLQRTLKLENTELAYLPAPVSIDCSHKYELKYEHGTTRVLRVGYAGNLSEDKGFFLLLKALTRACAHIRLELHVAGSFPTIRVKKLYSATVSPFPIIMMGKLERAEMPGFYLDLDLLVVPSLCAENQPQVLIEALALGLPSITSDVAGIRELVDAQSMYPAKDEEALAERILSWTQEPSSRPAEVSSLPWEDLTKVIIDKYNSIVQLT
jgi:glycosyltransferase involved in cell wall biosynthesis